MEDNPATNRKTVDTLSESGREIDVLAEAMRLGIPVEELSAAAYGTDSGEADEANHPNSGYEEISKPPYLSTTLSVLSFVAALFCFVYSSMLFRALQEEMGFLYGARDALRSISDDLREMLEKAEIVRGFGIALLIVGIVFGIVAGVGFYKNYRRRHPKPAVYISAAPGYMSPAMFTVPTQMPVENTSSLDASSAPRQAPPAPELDITQRFDKLNQLYSGGYISEEEYQKKKAEIMAQL